jgi:hypothetical protein
MKREAGRVVALSLKLGTSGFLVGGFLDGCYCGAVEFHLHIVCDFNDEGFLLHIGDDAVDAGVGYDLIAGFDGIHEFGVFFRLLDRGAFHGFVFVCTGYDGPAELLAIKPDGLEKALRDFPSLATEFPTIAGLFAKPAAP